MTAFGQDMSFYSQEYMRAGTTFTERLVILETIRDSGITATGEFYHSALRYLLSRSPDISNVADRTAAERSAVILVQGLAALRYQEAAWDVWQTSELFDVFGGNVTDGSAQQAALIALGQIGNKVVLSNLVQRLDEFNSQVVRNPDQRRRVNTAVIGFVSAFEAFGEAAGYRPVFFASVGPYDPPIREIAANALPNIVDDPSDVLVAMIRDPRSDPPTKLLIWREMGRTNMPNASKAKVAAAALDIGWLFQTTNRTFQTSLRELRKAAIDVIRQFGATDDSVYANLDRSYRNNFIANTPDYDEIRMAIGALTAINNDQSVGILYRFLNEINTRRRVGPWGNKERLSYEWIVSGLGATRSQLGEVRLLLTTISRNSIYTAQEREMAANALRAITGN